jgi:hypothetical protein
MVSRRARHHLNERKHEPWTGEMLTIGREPWVMSIPDMKDRYFLMPMLDGWTNVF